MAVFLGLDIGGTKMAGLLADSQGQTLAGFTAPTPVTGPIQLLEGITSLINELLARAGLETTDLTAAAVGIPGRVEAASGEVTHAVNLNLDRYPLGAALEAELDRPVIVENDVRAAAVGAYHYRFPATQIGSLAYLNLGTGVSAGVVLNGRLHRGRRGMAGEIGHVVVDPDGRLCNCGQRGCLETLIAGPALVRQAASVLGLATAASPADLYHAATAGNSAAAAQVERVSRTVALAIQWLMMTYDVDEIVLGGGVTHLGPLFLNPILAYLDRLRSTSPLLQAMLAPDRVLLLPAAFNAGIWGAIRLAEIKVTRPE